MKNLLIESIKEEIGNYYNNSDNYLIDEEPKNDQFNEDEYEIVGQEESDQINQEFRNAAIDESITRAINNLIKF